MVILSKIKEQQLSQEFKEVVGVEETDKEPVDNVTFEIADSRIAVDQHVHVSRADNSDSSTISKDCDTPEKTAEALQLYGQPDDKRVQVSEGVLKELNYGSGQSEVIWFWPGVDPGGLTWVKNQPHFQESKVLSFIDFLSFI